MSIINITTLNNYILNTQYKLTFIQVNKDGINNIDNISNIISTTNYEYNYIDVSSSEIYNTYSTDNAPILLIYLKYNTSSTIGHIPVYTTTTTTDIKNLIHSQLKRPKTIEELNDYLQYTKYDTTFIRLFSIFPVIQKEYIIELLSEYNKIEKSNYEYFEISAINILNFYKVKIKTLPTILLFKKSFYTITGLIPCKYLSGQPYYNSTTILLLNNFLKYGLK